MALNGVLVPRSATCWVCKTVGVVEDVTVRLFQDDGTKRQSYADAKRYIRGIGYSSLSDKALTRYLGQHAAHVEKSMVGGPAVPGELTRIEPPGPARWLDVNQNAQDVGNEALGILRARFDQMEDRDLVAVAKIGVQAAQKHGDWEAKGRKLAQVDELIRLAAGGMGNVEEA